MTKRFYSCCFDLSEPNYDEKRKLVLDLFKQFNGGEDALMILESQYLIHTRLTAKQMITRIRQEFSRRASQERGMLNYSNLENWTLTERDKFLINEIDGSDWDELHINLDILLLME